MNWNIFLKPQVAWIIVAVILAILELVVPGLLIIFFAIGALIVWLLTLFFHLSFQVQLIIWLVTSILSLIFLRKKFKKSFVGRASTGDLEANVSSIVGEVVEVTEAISPDRPGKVKLHGTNWDAEANEEIPVGTRVEITQQDGNHLTVKFRGSETTMAEADVE